MHSKNAFFCCLDIYKTNNFGFTLSLILNFFIINIEFVFNLLVYNGLGWLVFWFFLGFAPARASRFPLSEGVRGSPHSALPSRVALRFPLSEGVRGSPTRLLNNPLRNPPSIFSHLIVIYPNYLQTNHSHLSVSLRIPFLGFC